MAAFRTLSHALAVALVFLAISFVASRAQAHEGHAHRRAPAPEAAHFTSEAAPRETAHAPEASRTAAASWQPLAPASDCRTGCCAAGPACCQAIVAPPRAALTPPPPGRALLCREPVDHVGVAPEIRPKPPRRLL